MSRRVTVLDGRIAVVVGTRPEIIKLAVLVRLLGDEAVLVHTGQHYDHALSQAFLNSYGLPVPALVLDGIGGADRHTQISAVIAGLGVAFATDRPAVVVVQGDTNTAAAAAQAANFARIPLLHVEAGLRSHDRNMPEEINRRLVAVLADHHAAPTQNAADNLHREGVDESAVTVTGNTVVEAAEQSLPTSEARREILDRYGLSAESYVLATIHRPENTDDPDRLGAILAELVALPLPVVFPAHPRTTAAVARYGLRTKLRQLAVVDPVDHPTLLALAHQARLLVSDSGGIQEEVTVLKRPLIVVRNSTERPEAIDAGFAQLVAPGPAIGAAAARLLADPDLLVRLAVAPSPYGDGKASHRIAVLAREMRDHADTGYDSETGCHA